MALVWSALGRVSRRLSGSLIPQSAMRPNGQGISQSPPLPSFRSAVPWMPPRPGSAAAHTRSIPNLLLQAGRGTKGMKQSNRMSYLSTERFGGDVKLNELARSAVKRTMAWLNKPSDAHDARVEGIVLWIAWAWLARIHFFPKRVNVDAVGSLPFY